MLFLIKESRLVNLIIENELFDHIDDNLLQEISDKVIDENLEAYNELS